TSSKGTPVGSDYVRSDDFRKTFANTTGPVLQQDTPLEFAFLPTCQRHAFKMTYDPKANNNLGRITAAFDQQTISIDLDEQARAEGASFDRFGLASLRTGGKYMTVYFDDLTYTARRPANDKPVFHKQEVTKV